MRLSASSRDSRGFTAAASARPAFKRESARGRNVGVGDPLGENGELLDDWMFPPQGINSTIRDETFTTAGAVVIGRRLFDLGFDPWGNDPPFHMLCSS